MTVNGSRRTRIGVAIGSTLIVLTLIGCSVGSSKDSGSGGLSASTPSVSPIPIDSSAVPDSPAPDSTHTKSTSSTPPTAPTVAPPPSCKSKVGKALTKRQVLADLTKAAKINEYAHLDPLTLDSRLNGKTPNIHIPLNMLKAIAAEESGWQSNCASNDGLGFGTMQVDAAVATDMNTKFLRSYNRMNPLQNILLGNAYLDYLTAHFGIIYFHNNFNLKTNTGLRDAVIAAYNVGLNNVDRGGQIQIGPVGRGYVNTVLGLMQPSAAPQKTWGR